MSSDRLWCLSAAVPRPVTPLQHGEPCCHDLGWFFPIWSRPRFAGPIFCRDQFPKPTVMPFFRHKPPKQGAGLQDRVQPHIYLLSPQRKPGQPDSHRPTPLPVRRGILTCRFLPRFDKRPGPVWRSGPWVHVTVWRAPFWRRLPWQWHTASHQQSTTKKEGKFPIS